MPTTCSFRYDQIIETNVQGISLMQQSKYDEAIVRLKEGLMALLPQLNEAIANETMVAFETSVKGTRDSPQKSSLYPELRIDGSIRSTINNRSLFSVEVLPKDKVSTNDEDVFVLFNRALHLSREIKDIHENAAFYGQLLSGIIIYNLGLSHHLQGLKTGDSRMQSRALELYLLAYQDLMDQCSSRGEKMPTVNMALVSIVNNMGHIYAHFRRYEETSMCRDELSSRLTSLLLDHHPILTAVEYQIFFLNISFFQSELMCAPSA